MDNLNGMRIEAVTGVDVDGTLIGPTIGIASCVRTALGRYTITLERSIGDAETIPMVSGLGSTLSGLGASWIGPGQIEVQSMFQTGVFTDAAFYFILVGVRRIH